MKSNFSILIVASEAEPFAKTGGLGEYVSSLAYSLKTLGHHPAIIIPRYRSIGSSLKQKIFKKSLTVSISDRSEESDIYQAFLEEDIPVYLVDKPKYFDRDDLYRSGEVDYPDNSERFIYFSRAVFELIPHLETIPDIVHCNDWQTGLVPLYIKHFRNRTNCYWNIKTLFTIHNMAFQGLFWRFDMHLTGLPWDYFTQDGIEYYGDLNLLKAGIIFSDTISTVSSQYSKEIQTQEYGCGLDGLLRSQKKRLYGIQNGIDYRKWDPKTDASIASHYSIDDLSGKKACKKKLLKIMKMEYRLKEPIISVISRLTRQRGMDLLSEALPEITERDVKIVILGIGDRQYEEELKAAAERYKTKLVFFNVFDEQLAHEIEAGSDMFLMPSRYEPCGLNQLYSLRYGTVPIVRATGGLEDTVEEDELDPSFSTGFKFHDYSVSALIKTLDRALTVYDNRRTWLKIMKNGMKKDYSWTASAIRYSGLYEKIISL
ncbi:glycogen synthase GlgA [bacterium]|nr:glycogen synthase GlgA [candidate division CSSED10-310 bacterium]